MATRLTFMLDTCVCEYQVHKHVWTAPYGKILACRNDIIDPYAVAVVSSIDIVIDHASMSISAVATTPAGQAMGGSFFTSQINKQILKIKISFNIRPCTFGLSV